MFARQIGRNHDRMDRKATFPVRVLFPDGGNDCRERKHTGRHRTLWRGLTEERARRLCGGTLLGSECTLCQPQGFDKVKRSYLGLKYSKTSSTPDLRPSS
jgi:hypothetical protein